MRRLRSLDAASGRSVASRRELAVINEPDASWICSRNCHRILLLAMQLGLTLAPLFVVLVILLLLSVVTRGPLPWGSWLLLTLALEERRCRVFSHLSS